MSGIVGRAGTEDATAGRADHPHFVLEAIHAQPRVVEATLQRLVDFGRPDGLSAYGALSEKHLAAIRRVVLLGCGSSWHAALVGKYMLETLCGLPVEVDVASEFRHCCLTRDVPALVVAICQSGETVDVLEAARAARAVGATLLVITGARGSRLGREADGVIYTDGGPEDGVAAFGAQMAALAVLAIRIGRAHGSLSAARARRVIQELTEAPELMTRVLAAESPVIAVARRLRSCESIIVLARGINVPVAFEAALRLGEISDVHAEGHPAGEMTQRLRTAIDETVPVIVVVPQGRLRDKLIDCVEDLKARRAVVVALAAHDDRDVADKTEYVVPCPAVSELVEPLVFLVAVQLLAYYIAAFRERDVDRRRRARSV